MSSNPELKQGEKGGWVSYLQQMLEGAGFSPGPLDCVFGPRTHEADQDGGEDDDFASFVGQILVIVDFGLGLEADGGPAEIFNGLGRTLRALKPHDDAGEKTAVVGIGDCAAWGPDFTLQGASAGFEWSAADNFAVPVPAGVADQCAPAAARAEFVLDVVYHPWPTPMATAVAATGGRLATGLDMLLHQAFGQVEQFTGHPAPRAAMAAALPDRIPA